jgi:hypothetical protein
VLSILSSSTWHMPARVSTLLYVEVHGVKKEHSKNGWQTDLSSTNPMHLSLKNKHDTPWSLKHKLTDQISTPEEWLTYQYVSTHIHGVIHNKDRSLSTVSHQHTKAPFLGGGYYLPWCRNCNIYSKSSISAIVFLQQLVLWRYYVVPELSVAVPEL